MEVAIPTRKKREDGYPTAYKVDIGNTELKIAIEVDGNSHMVMARRLEDGKKVSCLEGLQWTVLRFSNRAVMEHLEDCVRTVLSTTSALPEPTHTSPTV